MSWQMGIAYKGMKKERKRVMKKYPFVTIENRYPTSFFSCQFIPTIGIGFPSWFSRSGVKVLIIQNYQSCIIFA